MSCHGSLGPPLLMDALGKLGWLKVCAADERGADGVIGLDGEDDVAGVVRAVDGEGLVPRVQRGILVLLKKT